MPNFQPSFAPAFRLICLAGLLASVTFVPSGKILAQAPPWKIAQGFSTDWEQLTFDRQQLGAGVFLLHASGGNTLVLTGPEGTLLVDPSFAQVAPKLKVELSKMGAAPVRYVVSTHYHGDHTGGNGAFAGEGAMVVGQANCRERMLHPQYNNFWGYPTPSSPVADLPTLTYDRRLTLYLNGEQIDVFHNRPAHTDGDSIVYLHHANVVHMGDIYINGLYPYIDLATGGRIDGYFPVIDQVLALIDDRTRVIPGHGLIASRADLQFYRDMLQTVRDRVAHQIASGATLEQVIASRPSREYDAQWASDRVGPDGFAALIYQSLTGKRLEWHPPRK
jgi:cyclase